jgi:hypothetical protein
MGAGRASRPRTGWKDYAVGVVIGMKAYGFKIWLDLNKTCRLMP